MKILIATGLYPPDIGGPATYTHMLEEYLPQHGIELCVVAYGSVRRHPKLLRHLMFAWKLIRESRGSDLIYALDPVSVGLPALIASVVTRKPLFLRIAGDYAWEQGQQRYGVTDPLDTFLKKEKPRPFFVRLLAWVQKWTASRAKKVIVPSDYMKGVVTAWGIPPEKITTIYSALHPLHVNETREELRTMFKYEGLVLVTAGRLVPWKGIGTLIKILPRLRETLGEVTLVIIGDGPLETELKAQAKEMGVSQYVRFVGRMPKTTLGAAIKGCDVFVLNTAYEGMSHQLIEVMDLGIPIVTTHIGGNPELIKNRVTGLLVAFDNEDELIEGIQKFAEDAAFREYVIQSARMRSKDFDRGKVTRELADFLNRYVTKE